MGVDNRDWSFTVIERGEGLRAAIVSARDGHAEISAAAPVSYRQEELPNAYVVADGSDVRAAARRSGLDFELVDIPAGDARDAFLRKWATAAKKQKKGLVPLLLLPLAACGGGGVESLLTSYDGDVAGAKALDATKYTSDFTISVDDAGAVAAADLTEVAGKTTGDVTSTSVTSVSGTAAEVQAALEDAQLVSLGAVDVVITDVHDLAQLKAINNATSGSITFNDDSVALSGSSADVAAALNGTTYTGNVTLSDAHDLAQLKTINAGTSGGITLHDASVALEGSASDLLAALDGVAPYSGNVTVTGTATAAQIEALAQLTTGTLTVTLAEGEAVLDLSAATAATVVTVSGDVNVTGSDQADKLIVAEGSNDDVDVVADLGKGADEVRVEDGAILAAKGDSIQITDGGNPGNTDKLTVSGTNVFDANSSWTDIEVLEIESSITFTAKQINAVGGNIKVADAVKDDLGEHKVTIAPVTEADLQPGETLAEANAVNLKTLEGVTAIAVGAGVAAELEKTAAENLAATQSKYVAAAVTVDTGIEVDSGAGAGEIVVSPEAKAALESGVTVKVGGVEVTEIPYSVSGTFGELKALDAEDAAYLSGASKVIVEDARPLDDLVVNAPLKDLASVVFAGGVKDDAANLLSGAAASAQLTTALGKHAAANITVTSTDVLTAAQVGTLQTAMGAYSSLTATVGGLASELATLREDVKGYANLTISVTDATAAPVNASDLKAIGLATSGTATVANKVAISGNNADVTAALVTPASKVVLGTADTPVTVADAVTAAEGAAIATATNAAASFTTGVVDALGNLSSGGTINSNLTAIKSDQSDVAIAISDADNFSAAAADLKVVGGATTGTVTVTNQAAISGNIANVTDALITADSKVVLSKASTATVADAVTAKQGGDIAGLANVTATFTTGVNDSLTNLLASAEADIDKVVADHASVAIVIDDAGVPLTAANLSTIGGKTNGTVTVENAAAISGSVAEVTAALVADLTKVVLGDASTVTVSGAVTAKEGADIANVAKATATFSNGVADALDKLAASGAITTDLTHLLGDDATVTITINDAGTLTAAAADLKAIGGATSGAVDVANAVAISGTAADVTAALVDAETKVVLDTASTVSVSNAVTSKQGADIADVANATATYADGVADEMASLYDTGSAVTTNLGKILTESGAALAVTVNDASGTLLATDLSGLQGHADVSGVTVSGAVTISGTESEITDALVTKSVGATLATAVVGDTVGVDVAAANLSAINAKVASVTVTNAIDVNGDIAAVSALQALAGMTLPADYSVNLTDTGAVAVGDLSAVAGKTTGAVVLANATTVSGSSAELSVLVGSIDQLAMSTANFTVSGQEALSLATLKALNVETSGAINLNNASLASDWSGSSGDLVAAFSGISNLSGAVTVTGASSITDLDAIRASTSGAITLSEGSFDLTGTASALKAALTGVAGYSGNLTVTDGNLIGSTGVSVINDIDRLTTGTVTAEVTGVAAQLKSLTTDTSDSITINLTSTITLADYTQITSKTALNVPYSGGTLTTVTEDQDKILTLDDFSFDGQNQLNIQKIKVVSLPVFGDIKLEGDPSVFEAVAVGQEITGSDIAAGKLKFQPLADSYQDQTFSFLVYDGVNDGSDVTLTLDLVSVEDAPVVTVPSARVDVDEKASAFVTGIAVTDVDTGQMSLTLSVDSGTLTLKTGLSTATITANGTSSVVVAGTKSALKSILDHPQGVTYTTAPGDADVDVTLTVTARSTGSDPVSDTISIRVNDVDEPPSVSVVDEADLIITQGEALDISLLVQDDVTSNPTVTLVSAPNWVNAISAGSKITSRATTNDEVGSHTLTIKVVDGFGNEVTEEIGVTVNDANDGPVFAAPTSTVTVAQHATLSYDVAALFSDPDVGSADPTLTVTSMPEGASYDPATGYLSWTPTDEKFVTDGLSYDPANNTVSITATDALGAEVSGSFVIQVTNTNDAPYAFDKSYAAAVTEGVWVDGETVDKTLNELNIFDQDEGDKNSTLSVTIGNATGSYGSLSFDNSTKTLKYLPDNAQVEALTAGETVSDAFTITVTDDEGLSSDPVTVEFGLVGENDKPVVTAPTFEELNSGAQDVTVGTLTGTDDVDGASLTFRLTDNAETDNALFEIVSGTDVKLRAGETTSSGASPYTLEVEAVDGDGLASDPKTFQVVVSATDTAPTILSIVADQSDAALGIGGTLNLTATASEAVKASSGAATFSVTLSNNQVVPMTRSTSDNTKFTGTYTVVEGHDASSDLGVVNITAGTVIDTGTAANALSTDPGEFSFTNLTVDAERPEAKITASGNTYDSVTDAGSGRVAGTLVLSGEKMNTLGVTVDVNNEADVKSLLNWEKLTWTAVGGTGTPSEALSVDDVDTAVVNTADDTITVTLKSAAVDVLQALSGFGGTGEGRVDTLAVGEGFLVDIFGNASTAPEVVATVEMVDQTAPVVASVTAATSTGASTVGVDDEITFTALMTDDSAMKVGTSFTLSLSNGASVVLRKTAQSGDKELVGTYKVLEGDTDSSDLQIAAMSASPTASDVSGNVLAAATPSLTNVDPIVVKGSLSEAKITASGNTYDSVTDAGSGRVAGTLVLSGEKMNTLGVTVDVNNEADVKSLLNWEKLTWTAVGGTGTPSEALSVDDVDTAVVNTADDTITVTLKSAAVDVLQALSGFGGTGEGRVDTLAVGEGFLVDIFGNASTAPEVVATVEMVDQTAPVVASVTAATSTGASTVGVDDEITFTALMTDDSAMKVGTSFTLSLSNGASVVLRKTAQSGDKELVGTYKVLEGDTDSSDLQIAAMSASPTASDVSGNVLAAATPSLTNVDPIVVKGSLSEAKITASGNTYDSVTDAGSGRVAGTLVLSGEKMNTLGVTVDVNNEADVKSLLNWEKLTWTAVGGTGTPSEALSVDDVDTAVVNTADDTITVTLKSAAVDVLQALSGFGGTGEGRVDTLAVGEGFLVDIFGNASTAPEVVATVEMVDQTAPVVASVTAATSTGASTVGVDDEITFTALMTDDSAMKVGTSFTLSLSNGASVVLRKTAESGDKELVGVYSVAETDEDAENLTILSMSASPTASDVSGNVLAAATPSLTNVDPIVVDTTAPTAQLNADGHSFDTMTDTLTLSVDNLSTLGAADGGSVTTQLDWSKFTWNAVGDDTTNSMTFESADILSAVVDLSAESIIITLTEGDGLGATELYAYSGFGGVGGKTDTLQVSEGFLNDAAGNASSEEDAVATVDVSMADTTAPVINTITAASSGGATSVAGDVITFTAVMADDNDMKLNTKFVIALSDGLGSVDLVRDASSADTFVGQYTVQAGDNSSGLSILAYSVPSTAAAKDVSGNKLEIGAAVSLVNDGALAIDTAAPQFTTYHTYGTDTLTVLFTEAISDGSRDALENAILELTGVVAVDDTYDKPLGARFTTDGNFDDQANITFPGAGVALADIYGNSEDYTTILTSMVEV